jgi:predicted glycosyltransferase
MERLEHARILMYSHDTFGLGHLRRCRAIAHALVERFKGLRILIVSGSPIAGAFDFKARVDFVKIPSVIKLHSGEYTSIDRHINLDETLAMRAAMIRDTARSFDPDIFIVDKEPAGLRGEIEETLQILKARGATLILGLRDVMDSPDLLAAEWRRKDMMRKIGEYYHQIWVYGPVDFWNPLAGLQVPAAIARRIRYTGFLERTVPHSVARSSDIEGDFILVTTGGGGDGSELILQTLAAYEADPGIPLDAVMVLGPFMPARERRAISRRAARCRRVRLIEFDNRLEKLIDDSRAVVGMCGYNTFCELLSFDKRALMVPRMAPRMEQFVRASRAADLGLVLMLHPGEAGDPLKLAAALRRLPDQPLPSAAGARAMLNGLDTIGDRVVDIIEQRDRPMLTVIESGV